MKCNWCHSNQNEVLVLRKKKFTRKGRGYSRFHRVCFSCAQVLARRGIYNFSSHWNRIFGIYEEKLQIEEMIQSTGGGYY